ncbi:MAG: class I SAM-dependent methyltransferase [Oscillospiraceae bacterium]|jgi:putative AdoMet-dependent methyltransferase|nr:class I SAM-dependent methyltransferase [Oscillospiraceae bacterium]
MNNELFENWASNYDATVEQIDQSGGFPFAGYEGVLRFIYGHISPRKPLRILDLGIGSGRLSHQLSLAGCAITGVDFSEKMLSKARELMPDASLIVHDLSSGLPPFDDQFDAIISTYALHHFDPKKQIELIDEMAKLLAPGGTIYIGDVVFSDREAADACHKNHADDWDESEYYFVYSELSQALAPDVHAECVPISWCGGVVVLSKGH